MSHTYTLTREASFAFQPLTAGDYTLRIGLAIAALSTNASPEVARTAALDILLGATTEDRASFTPLS